MQTIAASPSSTFASLAAPALHAGPILVAVDVPEASAHARTIAQLIASAAGAELELVTVLEPRNEILPQPEPLAAPAYPGATRVENRHERMEALVEAGDPAAPHSTELRLGDPVREILRAAEARDARLIVTRLAHHGALEQLVHRATPLAIVNDATIPVLAVPDALTGLPRQVVIAVNDGTAVAQVGALGASLMREAVAVHLVHVKPQRPVYYDPESREADEEEEACIARNFAAVRSALRLPPDVPVESHVLTGDLTQNLMGFADDVHADLIVVGHSMRMRMLPSRGLTAKVFRNASCAVLLAPAPRADEDPLQGTKISVHEDEWPAMLHEFTQRNFGRALALAVDERHAGSSVMARGLHLVAADYDQKARTLTVAARDAGNGAAHLSHRIVRPTVIATELRSADRDETLVAGYDGGQLILTMA